MSDEEFEYGESERGESEEGREDISEYGESEEGEPSRKPKSMKDIERTEARGLIEGTVGLKARISQTEEDKFILEMNSALNSALTHYTRLKDSSIDERREFFSKVTNIENVERYNADVMLAALYYIKYVGLPVTKEEITTFSTPLNEEEKLDVVRYVRMLVIV